jgi:Uma2 family endonuclease
MSAVLDREPPIPKASAMQTLDAFREWMHTAAPECGRFWFVRGKFEADMSPEKISVHNFVKAALYGTLVTHAQKHDVGEVFPDGAFLVNEAADLGTEPDMMFCSWDCLTEGRVQVRAWRRESDGDVEVHGTPDMVVEIVSDSSVRKDNVELRQSYFDAGIPEYWLIDARGDEIDFQLLVRGADDYVAQPADAKGYLLSPCFGRRFLLTRKAHKISGWSYRLLTRAE